MKQALDLNVPALQLPGIALESDSFLQVQQENILLDTVKKAEDEEAVIVRLYEYYNRQTQAVLESKQPIKRALLCNLLEEDEVELAVDHQKINITFAPYEIQTVKIFFE